ncbi:MAG: fibronectin type III domain-containing protein [Actinomycetota bacterium]|nr:fibronectin type III domain-containing protein [Actinomycetota bacterium]
MTAPRRVAAILAVGAALVGLTAPPASAADELVVTIDQPPDTTSKTVLVSGEVKAPLELLDIDWVAVALIPERGGGAPIGARDACRPCNRTDGKIRFSVSVPVDVNWRYRAEVTAGKSLVLTEMTGKKISEPFAVAAPPRAPQNVKVEVSPERIVTVSWDRNPEPDMLHYVVSRKDPGGDSFRLIGEVVRHPTSSFVDRTTTAAGGDYAYQVVAVRSGATAGSRVSSGASEPRSISVPAPAPGDATGGPAAGRADVSGFLANQPRTSSAPGPPRTLLPPDTGFSQTLPFGARPPAEEIEEGEQEPRSLEVGTTTSEYVSRGRPLVPVAAGAILLLLAVHLRLLNQRVKAVPATVSGPAYSDLAKLDDGGFDHNDRFEPPVIHPQPVTRIPALERLPVGPAQADLFDYEHEQPANAVADEAWAEREWEDEIREVDAQIREMVGTRRP